MKTEEAFALLKLPLDSTAEQVEEKLEQALFDVKYELLRMEVVPRVFLARIVKLQRLYEAECVLFEEAVQDFPRKAMPFPSEDEARNVLNLDSDFTIKMLVKSFESEWTLAKQQMSSAQDFIALAEAIRAIARVQYAYESVFSSIGLSNSKTEDLDLPKQNQLLSSASFLLLVEEVNVQQIPVNELPENWWLALKKEAQIKLFEEQKRVEQSRALAK